MKQYFHFIEWDYTKCEFNQSIGYKNTLFSDTIMDHQMPKWLAQKVLLIQYLRGNNTESVTISYGLYKKNVSVLYKSC